MTIRTLQLADGQIIRFDNLRGGRLQCRSGTLWITVDGQMCDILMEAGDDFQCESCAPVIVHALAGLAVLTLKEGVARPPSVWKRTWDAIVPRTWQGAW